MKSARNKAKVSNSARDGQKESIFKALVLSLRSAGYEVRREKLKQGHGWKVVSGACRAGEQSMIFVDSRMPQDDQILFLKARMTELGIVVPEVSESKPEVKAA